MGILNFPPGDWWLKSQKDPRWNCSGRSNCVGGFVMPQELKDKIEELKEKFGKPPDDAEWGYMKD